MRLCKVVEFEEILSAVFGCVNYMDKLMIIKN